MNKQLLEKTIGVLAKYTARGSGDQIDEYHTCLGCGATIPRHYNDCPVWLLSIELQEILVTEYN